jgi:hypothetical protein
MLLRMARKRQVMPLTVEPPTSANKEHHTEQVNLSLKVLVVFHAQQLPQK